MQTTTQEGQEVNDLADACLQASIIFIMFPLHKLWVMLKYK